ncbi:Hypothetical protein SMAX5B_006724 [Scophthalmus maximus]|uniref:Uncharacterized protein n=1 Tax=Scophthalmus maximus TaxID=52904 RepID=A0A2U9C823_SCOMX|nr:Hypothetical protein SMAX5B_006724 [Scophthalmus maximus]
MDSKEMLMLRHVYCSGPERWINSLRLTGAISGGPSEHGSRSDNDEIFSFFEAVRGFFLGTQRREQRRTDCVRTREGALRDNSYCRYRCRRKH